MPPILGCPILGCIADDFTGATDLASMLVRNGMRSMPLASSSKQLAPNAL